MTWISIRAECHPHVVKLSLSRLANTDPERHRRRWLLEIEIEMFENMKVMANGRDEVNELVHGLVVCQVATGMMTRKQKMAWLK